MMNCAGAIIAHHFGQTRTPLGSIIRIDWFRSVNSLGPLFLQALNCDGGPTSEAQRLCRTRRAVDIQPVLFIQGAGSMHAPEGSGRLAAYLVRELGTGYRVLTPEMPDFDSPEYQAWRDRIEQELDAIDQEVILVGHSLGGSVLLKYLAEGTYEKPVGGLFLVSVPNWSPSGWAYAEYAAQDDVGSSLPPSRIFLYHSRDDPEVPFAHLGYYHQNIPMATVRPIDGSDHSFVEGLPSLVHDIKSLRR